MKLPQIYEHFRQGQVFTIEEARIKLQINGNALRKKLSELSLRGYISHIRQGLYRLSKIDSNGTQQKSSPFVIASKLTSYCYVGYSTALYFHAQETPKENSTVYVVSPTKFNFFKFEGYRYFWCQNPDANGIESYSIKEQECEHSVLITNLEKTLVDCLKRPTHCPGFYDLIYLCQKISFIPDLEKILRYASDCNVQAVFNRLGILFEQNRAYWEPNEEFFKLIEQKMSRKQIEWPIPYLKREDQSNIKNKWKILFPL